MRAKGTEVGMPGATLVRTVGSAGEVVEALTAGPHC